MKCGLLGKKLGHSYSPQIHSFLGDYDYSLFEKEPEELADFLKYGDFHGINVTIPYKKDVIPYLDALSPTAQAMGAVNTIVRRVDGSLWGHNTDYYGFRSMVDKCAFSVSGKKVLVLGSGGASNTAVTVLKEMGANVIVISRSGENNYNNLSLHADAAAIVNATPVGMYPHNGVSPVDLDLFSNLQCVLDVVYNPAKTQLLLDAEARNIPFENGLWMLVAQAKEASECFLGSDIENEKIQEIYTQLSMQMQNIVLIGMPGCGKTTIGKCLAEQLGRTFVDADSKIAEYAGITIPEIFSQYGEPEFRDIETKVLSDLGKQSGLIIATGGGCVTKVRNYPLLHQNGILFYLLRDLSLLPTDGRPLSQANALSDLFAQRKKYYEAFSDYIIDNNGEMEFSVSQILSKLEVCI